MQQHDGPPDARAPSARRASTPTCGSTSSSICRAATTCVFYLEYTPNDGTNFYLLIAADAGQAADAWANFSPVRSTGPSTTSTGTGYGPAAANAIFNNANFGIRFRGVRASGTGTTYFYVDDVEVDMYKFVNRATSCTGDLPRPRRAVDRPDRGQQRLRRGRHQGLLHGFLGAASYNLLKDGSVAVTGYTSGTLYVPGDTASHNYAIRAVNTGGNDRLHAGQAFIDAAGTAIPTITCTPAPAAAPRRSS